MQLLYPIIPVVHARFPVVLLTRILLGVRALICRLLMYLAAIPVCFCDVSCLRLEDIM